MRKLSVFNQVSIDGYFTSRDGDVGWTHQDDGDPEFEEFTEGNASGGGALIFGRKTYEMMVSFWPTPAAAKQFPVVARQMNALPKIVFSRTLKKVSWNNTALVKGEPAAEMRKMKSAPGEDMTILGSGTIVSQLAREGLIDEYRIVMIPIVLGDGRTMFQDLQRPLDLELVKTRAFRNGRVVLQYKPKARGVHGKG
jgi:dihydrofolate reductase